jgi:hypothetical protein
MELNLYTGTKVPNHCSYSTNYLQIQAPLFMYNFADNNIFILISIYTSFRPPNMGILKYIST